MRISAKTRSRPASRRRSRRLEISVVVAEADAVRRREMRETIDGTPGLHLAGQAIDASTAVDLCASESPDIVVMSAALPGRDPLSTCRKLARLGAEPARPVVVTSNGSAEGSVDFLIAGADGVVPHGLVPARLPDAVATVASGAAAVGPELSGTLLRRFQMAVAAVASDSGGWRPVLGPLSAREWEVVDELRRGAQPDEIAIDLGIARATVRSHLRNIYRKLGVSSRPAAIAAAERLKAGLPGGRRESSA